MFSFYEPRLLSILWRAQEGFLVVDLHQAGEEEEEEVALLIDLMVLALIAESVLLRSWDLPVLKNSLLNAAILFIVKSIDSLVDRLLASIPARLAVRFVYVAVLEAIDVAVRWASEAARCLTIAASIAALKVIIFASAYGVR